MARHRNVRKLDFDDEYGYDDVYGRSLEDEPAVSPSTAAQFLYTRESRAAPSLLSFIDTSGGGDIGHSISEPYKSQSKSKLTTSPLASSSVSTSTTALGKEIIGPPPGFKSSAKDSLHCTKEDYMYIKRNNLQERTTSDFVSLYNPSNIRGYDCSLTEKSLPGLKKEDSNSCLQKLAPFRLVSVRGGLEQGQRMPPDFQKSLVHLVTEDKSSVSYPMEKNAPVTTTKECKMHVEGQIQDMNNLIKFEPKAVPLEPLSLAQIIQHEAGTSYVHSMPGEIHFNPSAQAQRSCSSNELSLFDLAKLSSKAASWRPVHVKTSNDTTLSGLSSHCEIVSRIPNLTRDMGIHVVALHSTRHTSVEVTTCSSASPAVFAFKSDLTINYEHKGSSIEGKSHVFALMASHPIEDGVLHYLSRFRHCVHKKLTQDYMRLNFIFFNFSTESPDDVVREKQRNVFQK